MAVVTIASTDNGEIRTWDLPAPLEGEPRGEVVFQGTDAITAKSATDTTNFTLQCNFPRNFVYRVVEASLTAFGTADSVFADFEDFMRCIVSSDAPDFDDFSAVFHNVALPLTSSAGQHSFQHSLVVTNDFMTQFLLTTPLDGVAIDANSAAARLFINWVDPSADSTTAVNIFWRIRALQYSVEQFNNYAMHNAPPRLRGG